MIKDIYKITNLINNKIYVGQSVNMKHRWEQHVSSSKHNPKTLIDKAIEKYGELNFCIELIERTEQYDLREKYWINYYHATNHDIGYNISNGGDSVGSGIDHPCAKIKNQEVLNNIIDDIRNSKMNFTTIAQLYDITPISVSEINNGVSYKQEDLEYPLRETKYTEEFYKRLIYSIKYELDKPLKEIAREYNLDLSYVVELNSGSIRWRSYLSYPLRKSYAYRGGCKAFENIVDDLLNSNLSQQDIAKKYNVSFGVVSSINNGRSYKKEDIHYPIRNNYQSNIQKRILSPDEVSRIEDMLINTDYSCKYIAELIQCHPNTVQHINSGTTIKYKDQNKKYPLRKMHKQ